MILVLKLLNGIKREFLYNNRILNYLNKNETNGAIYTTIKEYLHVFLHICDSAIVTVRIGVKGRKTPSVFLFFCFFSIYRSTFIVKRLI